MGFVFSQIADTWKRVDMRKDVDMQTLSAEIFKDKHFGALQGAALSLQNVCWVIIYYFQTPSSKLKREIQEGVKDFSIVVLECFQSVSNVFQGSFKNLDHPEQRSIFFNFMQALNDQLLVQCFMHE